MLECEASVLEAPESAPLSPALLTPWTRKCFAMMCCPVCCGTSRRTYLLDTRSHHPCCDNPKWLQVLPSVPWAAESPNAENHCYKNKPCYQKNSFKSILKSNIQEAPTAKTADDYIMTNPREDCDRTFL